MAVGEISVQPKVNYALYVHGQVYAGFAEVDLSTMTLGPKYTKHKMMGVTGIAGYLENSDPVTMNSVLLNVYSKS